MTQSTDQVTNAHNTKAVIKPDQFAILQELSRMLNIPLKEVKNVDELKYSYQNLILYCLSQDSDVIGLAIYY
jgi:hypothetical protein